MLYSKVTIHVQLDLLLFESANACPAANDATSDLHGTITSQATSKERRNTSHLKAATYTRDQIQELTIVIIRITSRHAVFTFTPERRFLYLSSTAIMARTVSSRSCSATESTACTCTTLNLLQLLTYSVIQLHERTYIFLDHLDCHEKPFNICVPNKTLNRKTKHSL